MRCRVLVRPVERAFRPKVWMSFARARVTPTRAGAGKSVAALSPVVSSTC